MALGGFGIVLPLWALRPVLLTLRACSSLLRPMVRTAPRRVKLVAAGLWAAVLCAALGCSSLPFGPEKDRTSIITPGMRMAAVREFGPRADNADQNEQQRLCEQLALQIQTEPDPLVRQEIQNAVANFDHPLSLRMLLAGLHDDDVNVRLTCCNRLAERADPAAIGPLRSTLETDKDLDVRLAAIDALGKIQSTESVQALGVALTDRDPAVQYAGVQALKSASGQDLGNDVTAWQQYVSGANPEIKPAVSVAERVKEWTPFY